MVPVRLSDSLLSALDDRAKRQDITRSEVIRAALGAYLGNVGGGASSGRLSLSRTDADRVRQICERFGVQRLEVFGSYARGEATASSDVDLLYTLRPGVRLGWAIEDLAAELTSVLGNPVDLVARHAVHERMRDVVFAEAEVLYAA